MEKKLCETASYRIISDKEGNRFRFFCGISGIAVYTSNPVRAEITEDELRMAWELEGKKHFNLCHKCERWASDIMYNADVCECIDCAPWENEPKYCHKCGSALSTPDIFCRKCGARLRYGEVWT